MLADIMLLQASPIGGEYQSLIFIGGLILIFYFFMIRPQQKKQKEQKKFIEQIKKGDKVVTVGGMHGTVYSVSEETVTLDVDKGTKITFEKASISLDSSKKSTK